MKANAPLWMVSLGQGGGDAAAVGGPDAPTITSQGSNVVTFTAGKEGAAGPTLGYGAEIEPAGPTLTVEAPDPAAGGQILITNSTPFVDYVVTIYGVNVAGRGKAAKTDSFQLNFNAATGGNLTDEYTVAADGSRWRFHQFTGNGTLTITSAAGAYPFRTLVVGGGGNGHPGGGCSTAEGGSGGSGGLQEDKNRQMTTGAKSVTVGGAQTPSTFDGITASGGGTGANSWYNTNGSYCAGGATGSGGTGTLTSDISGVSTVYGGHSSPQTAPTRRGQGGGGGRGPDGGYGNHNGNPGIVIIAYQVGMSTARQIDEAVALQAAHDAAYTQGHDVGVAEGIQIQQYAYSLSSGAVAPAQLPTDDKDKKPK